MITIEMFCIIFGCSMATARRRIMEMYRVSGVKCPENNRIPLSMLTKYKGVTRADVEFALDQHDRKLRESL